MLGGTRGHVFKGCAERQLFYAGQVDADSKENFADAAGAVHCGIVCDNMDSNWAFGGGIISVYADSQGRYRRLAREWAGERIRSVWNADPNAYP